MSRYTRVALSALTLAVMSTAAHGQIVNPSFEDVYPSPNNPYVTLPVGWNTWTYQDWDTSWAGEYDDFMYSPISPSAGQRMGINSDIGALWQSVTLSAGDTIIVDVAMATNASSSYGDAIIALGTWPNLYAASASNRVPWGGGVGGFGTPWIGWQTLSLTVPATGTYDLMLFGHFAGTGDGGTATYFDNIRVVPAPGSAALLGLGGLLAARRRR